MENLSEKIKKAYQAYVSAHGERPKSVYAFVEKEEFTEQEFYQHYNSFQALETDIWDEIFQKTLEKVQGEAVYAEYSGREKMLSFFFTLIEMLKAQRSFVTFFFRFQQRAHRGKRFSFERLNTFKKFREGYLEFARDVVMEASDTGEILMRPIIGDRYPELLWPQTLFIIKFWVEDTSDNFENTDAAIEKSVNLSFDLMSKTPLDSAFEFAKFVVQNRWW